MDDANNYSMLNDPEMKEIVDSFIIETREILDQLDLDLVELENQPKDTELLNKIFRAFHTIKGTSGFLGLSRFTTVTHRCEDLLNKLRKFEIELDSEIMDGILYGYDVIKELLESVETNRNEDVETGNVIEILKKLIDGSYKDEIAEDNEPEPEDDGEQDEPADETTGEESQAEEEAEDNKDELKKETSAPENIQKPQPEKKPAPPKAAPSKPAPQVKKAPDNQPARQQNQPAKKIDTSIRVDVARLDDLLNIVSELVLGRNRLSQLNSEFGLEFEGTKYSRDLSEATRQIDLMTNELQLVVMKTRMVKIGKIFNRFPRLVRDLSKEMNKEVNLIIHGEETELDKTLIEEINDPLVHLIRNSVDHGVESPEDREKANKPRKGNIILSAEHEGNNIIISIEDDGKGIDPKKITEAAIKKGILTEEKAQELTNRDAYNLIFQPGFSTAKKVSNVSGRGVGMDVVRTNVLKLRGMIKVDSEVGKGTKIQISLPLTLAIIHGMIVKVKSEMAVIPLSSVLEVIRVQSEDIYSIKQKEVLHFRDRTIPLISIEEVLSVQDEKSEGALDWQYVVIVKIAEKTFGIKVDALIGQKEVVIKSLGTYLGNIQGIAGSTIMGDGRVVMILDLSELIAKMEADGIKESKSPDS